MGDLPLVLPHCLKGVGGAPIGETEWSLSGRHTSRTDLLPSGFARCAGSRGPRHPRHGSSRGDDFYAGPASRPGDPFRSSAGASSRETGRRPCRRRLTSWSTTASSGAARFTAARYTTVPE